MLYVRKYILGLKGAEEQAAMLTGAGVVLKDKRKLLTVLRVKAPLCFSTAPTTCSETSGKSINQVLAPCTIIVFHLSSTCISARSQSLHVY